MTKPTRPFVSILRRVTVVAVFLSTTIVAAPNAISQMAGAVEAPTPLRLGALTNEDSAESAAANLVMRAFALIGTKYKLGGNSTETGFDCSGFIRHLYETAVDLSLPRTSFEMSRLGTKVDLQELVPGDLVFYNTRKRSFSHVGIYIGEDRFIHSPSKGRAVEIVEMRDRYWQRRFNGARRILQDSSRETSSHSALMGPELPTDPSALSAIK